MSKPLKHLNALHAFEASARLGSFARAATELGVTPAAVGQQIRQLEDYLGRKLFFRNVDGLQPTPVAERALPEVQSGFDRLRNGFDKLRGPVANSAISITVAPAFASRWLAPRLQSLYQRCPEIDLRIDTSLKTIDISGGEFDMAIRYGPDESAILESELLFEEYSVVVCRPDLGADVGSITKGTVVEHQLLHIEGETSDAGISRWYDWCREYDVVIRYPKQVTRYPQSAMAIQAALNGQGMLICGLSLVLDDLIRGVLVSPAPKSFLVKTQYAYRLLHTTTGRLTERQSTFIRWLEMEARKTRESILRYLEG